MFFTASLIGAGVLLFRHTLRRGEITNTSGDHRPLTRAEALGEHGELLTQFKLRETLKCLCGDDYYLHEGPLILVSAPGSNYPTIEIDHLVVTLFGVFVIETKHWSGQVDPSPHNDYILRSTKLGETEERKSPLSQNRSKLSFIRTHLPRQWAVAGAGVFTSPDANLSPHLPSDLIRLDDMPQWLRTQRDLNKGKQAVDIPKAVAAILQYRDRSPKAASDHKSRITFNSKGNNQRT